MADSYLGESIKKLGFGLMRLPMNGDEIDMDQTKKMVDTFMSKGFTYFDTAYVYIGGKSEVALKGGRGGPLPPGQLPVRHQAAFVGPEEP